MHPRFFRGIVCLAFLSALPAIGAAQTAEFALRPGHLYAGTMAGIEEYDASLNFVARHRPTGLDLFRGLAFTPNGNLVYTTRRVIDGSRHQHVVEIDASGSIVRERDLGSGGGPDGGTHLDIDVSGRIYVASRAGVVEVAADFSSHRVLSGGFLRASGVAIGPDDRLYVTDQESDTLTIFDQNRERVKTMAVGIWPEQVPIGVTFTPQGDLWVCMFRGNAVVKVDPVTETNTPALTGLYSPVDVAFAPDDGYYLLSDGGHWLQHYQSDNTLLQSLWNPGWYADAVVVMVPEPGTILMLLAGTLLALRRRLAS